ncbi:11781_t:CDS:2 [Funneliformis geosporum]|uniref:11781_t:CDS:1 n=1 Tax=Funneliformis geosporum TaxID=1117311 RepID=A0A9W4SDH7_9GLOM|nr:11781_t:CDS:2 [Funneliformis geosporum]
MILYKDIVEQVFGLLKEEQYHDAETDLSSQININYETLEKNMIRDVIGDVL